MDMKPISAISPEELEQILKETDYDAVIENEVISDENLHKLLDRTSLLHKMKENQAQADSGECISQTKYFYFIQCYGGHFPSEMIRKSSQTLQDKICEEYLWNSGCMTYSWSEVHELYEYGMEYVLY